MKYLKKVECEKSQGNLSLSAKLVNCDGNQKLESEDLDLVAEVKENEHEMKMVVQAADFEME